MPKAIIVPKQLTDKQELEKITQETLAITKKNDKELTDDEKLSVKNASKLNVQDFPLIFPMRATIGFMVRNMDGKNHQAIEFIRASLPLSTLHMGKNYLYDLVREFDDLDEDSKNRVDCLDWLARRNKVSPARLTEAITDGIVLFNNQMTRAIIAAKKPDIAEKIIKNAENASLKLPQHTQLAAKMTGLIDEKPLVQVDTGNKTVNNNTSNTTVVLGFNEWVKNNDKEVRGQLGEKKEEYVDGEVVNE